MGFKEKNSKIHDKMKRSKFFDSCVQIYSHCWFVPLFAFLLGVKICLISLLVDSIQMRHGHGLTRQSPRLILDHDAIRAELRSKMDDTSSMVKDSSSSEDGQLLANLPHVVLTPTHINRTANDSIWLVYNRVPRCGGTTLVNLLEKLAESNGFSHQEHEYHTPWPRTWMQSLIVPGLLKQDGKKFLLDQEQENLVTWFEYQHLPKSYDRHFYFVNFTRYQKYVKEKPIYVNLVRDPILRIRSFFLAKRANPAVAKMEMSRREALSPGSGVDWFRKDFDDCVLMSDSECAFENGTRDFTLVTPFFCGQHNSCVIINDHWASQMAKYNIEKSYSVVGVLEKLNETLRVMEAYIPRFFTGADALYNQLEETERRMERNWRNSLPISPAVRTVLETKLYSEVDLYRFIVTRLESQYSHISRSQSSQ